MIRNCCGQRQRGRPHLNICIIGTPLGRDRENAGVACRRHLLLLLLPRALSNRPKKIPSVFFRLFPPLLLSADLDPLPFSSFGSLFNNLGERERGRTKEVVKETRGSRCNAKSGMKKGETGGEIRARSLVFERNPGRERSEILFSTKKRQYRRARSLGARRISARAREFGAEQGIHQLKVGERAPP